MARAAIYRNTVECATISWAANNVQAIATTTRKMETAIAKTQTIAYLYGCAILSE